MRGNCLPCSGNRRSKHKSDGGEDRVSLPSDFYCQCDNVEKYVGEQLEGRPPLFIGFPEGNQVLQLDSRVSTPAFIAAHPQHTVNLDEILREIARVPPTATKPSDESFASLPSLSLHSVWLRHKAMYSSLRCVWQNASVIVSTCFRTSCMPAARGCGVLPGCLVFEPQRPGLLAGASRGSDVTMPPLALAARKPSSKPRREPGPNVILNVPTIPS